MSTRPSNLFERLIAPTESGTVSSLLRQPKGTYYTPADIADEMVKDALAAAVKESAGALQDGELLDLFGDPDIPLPIMEPADRQRLTEHMRELRIFDPAVSSGEFLFSALLAIRRALKKLGIEEPAETIIKRQLRGQDINPLAVQIARLRLFIAITAARKIVRPFQVESDPLPNLEAIIVCADTLETVADPDWRSVQLDMADPQIGEAVREIVSIRSRWFEVHSENQKMELLKRDVDLRAQLERLLDRNGDLASSEMRAFTKAGLMTTGPAQTDARLLFNESSWRGFDVVIGNPPYEALSKSKCAADIKNLSDGKRYRTTGGGDLYNLFCETALALAKPDGGVVALIVPLSIAFGQNKRTLREIFNRRSTAITLRHYNNRPDTPFNASPTVTTPENRQRASIVLAVLGDKLETAITTMGLQSWHSEQRHLCLGQRRTTPIPRLHPGVDRRIKDQWPRIPTPEVAELVERMVAQKRAVGNYQTKGGSAPAFPSTAYHFISVIPPGTVSPRSEQAFFVENDGNKLLTMAALNGHVAHAWWQIFGDGFHVKSSDFAFMTIPDAWSDDPQWAADLGQRLLDAMPECLVENKQQGDVWRNVDFHTYAPKLVAELDHLHIAALGLPEEPLLTHLRIMRSSNSWNYPTD